MTQPWITVAPLNTFFAEPTTLPLQFSDRVSIIEIPDWLRIKNGDGQIDLRFQEAIEDCTHAIAVNYEAAALDRSQQQATDEAHHAMLALWLTKPTLAHFLEVAHLQIESGNSFLIRQIGQYDPFFISNTHNQNDFDQSDFQSAVKLYATIMSLNKGSLLNALNITRRAACERDWLVRYTLFWIALEALYGTDREISFRLSQRVSLFLETAPDKKRDLFRRMKEDYGWRSKVIHGADLKKLEGEKSLELMNTIDDIVHRSLLKILADAALINIFSDGSKTREGFLDELSFR